MQIAIGIDLGGTSIKTAAVTSDGVIIAQNERPTQSGKGYAFVLDEMAASAREVTEQAGQVWQEVVGVGIGVPAFLDFEKGIVEEAVNLGWGKVPVVQELSQRLSVPIAFENDANAAAFGEAWVGGGKGYRDVFCVTLGTGVGGGIVIDDKVLHGGNGMAGEIGHVTIDPDGRLCNCGRKGCLEAISSATGMVALARQRIEGGEATSILNDQNLTAKTLFEHASVGDSLAQSVVEYVIDRLGFALANAAVVLNPQVIVVGGGVSKAGEALIVPLQSSFNRYAIRRVAEGTVIHLAQLGNDAGVIGAARLIWNR